ncbi:MAG TPA: 16S rRNA (guanine(966)-N(2))-methyltransferase RsmD [Steroidobacteraceae bacterium]|nr:16S rRNA (guanine(966)-N(2))-methyltransferase RsmD [Steroidobacteraceae bacterium]
MASSRKTAARSSAPAARAGSARVLRIIGGSWRGRRLRFPAVPLIRPTPDRVRETLFNWLGARVAAARCLDLFAGSGALGLEALSRGAAHVTFVERDAAAVRELGARLTEWGARGARVERGDALAFLAHRAHPFDIAFLDPPFASGLLGQAAALLEGNGWLSESALIYVECGAREGVPPLPARWLPLKAKRAGEVGYHLYARGQA